VLITAVALAAIVLAVDVATSSGSPPRAVAAATPTPQRGFAAHRLRSHAKGVLKPGSTVKSSALGTRVFTGNQNGFALANVKDVTYPAATSDGGKTWKTNGPEFHLPAAQAPLVVTMAGAAKPATDFAWGGPEGGNVINVTTDGGKAWWQSSPPGVVLSVIAVRPHKLIAIVQGSATSSGRSAVTWVYVSTDGGRHWKYNNRLGAM
jgi:photosystem II stability/assembly factor-like uncharacterized protein